ncbi:MAG: hypothetical protein KJ565_00150 [Gammaproteobacteria bacterium]|uniref:hypothetical protein n=1 Tax=Hydrogenophaga sp. TaxID=1904254 RepID=UPI0025C1D662|nr:hypothetical protein [Hydrogenophaga sp.]MBU4180075.1 hypothetical protein [Gammaproteobacteria bacterium]MBU4279368.1 hypothetical protein [Gammaproteobacteria bacterium]MBU4324701.1 hypothetical protein [Gammaproteobacteria bacterium]MCG2654207.1 hypothetical protein [Hydrogenophaga sp.]
MPDQNKSPDNHDSWFADLVELVKHVFIGAVLFLLLAIPAIGLDFLNQGVQLLEFRINGDHSGQRTSKENSDAAQPPGVTVNVQAKVVTVSAPVRWVLTGFEWLLLAVDTLGVGGYVLSSLVKYLRKLRWQ